MAHTDQNASLEEFAREFMAKAAQRWGPDRAEAIKDKIDDVARCLWLVSENPPDLEEEPAFFL